MDSEEYNEINELKSDGRPETTRGPYYHKAWWEGYKGGVKGLLGGVIIGGGVGALIGLGAVGAVSFVADGVAAFTWPAITAASAFGMYKGAEKFENVGITAGAVSASNEIAEVRMKEYVREKFRGLTNEIRELKSALKGTKPVSELKDTPQPFDSSPVLKEEDFRTNHLDEHGGPNDPKYVYPKVMAVGTLVGLGVGAVLGNTDIAHTLSNVVSPDLVGALGGSLAAPMALVGAMVGASFGISRDLFRAVFDVTDRLFLGIMRPPEKGSEPTRTYDVRRTNPTIAEEPSPALSGIMPPAQERFLMSPSPDVTLTESPIISADKFQSMINSAGKQALLGLDHTQAVRH